MTEKLRTQVMSTSMPMAVLYILWDLLEDTPIDDHDCIDQEFLDFKVGTNRYEIWHWFEECNPRFIVGEVMEGKRVTE